MEQSEVNLPYRSADVHHITPLFDLHLEADDSDDEALAQLITERNKLPNHSYILGGDIGDWIVPSDLKRYRPSNARLSLAQCDDYVGAALDYQCKVLQRCNKIDLVVDGNHEATMLGRHHVDVAAELASRLPGKPPLGGMSGYLRYNLRRAGNNGQKSLTIAYHHGFSVGQAAISPATIRWFCESMEGWDLALFGHNHKLGSYALSSMRPSRFGAPSAHDRYIVACGTMLRNYQSHRHPGYGEIKGHAVTRIGAPLIVWREKHLCGLVSRAIDKTRREAGHPSSWIDMQVIV